MKYICIRKIFSALLFSGLFAMNANAHELILKVDKITKPKGVMMIAVYNSADGYNSNTSTFSGEKVAITQNTLSVNLGDVPAGDYAIKLYQDENENGEIDKNILGIPTEGYGFSNNSGSMGQPSFEKAKFSVAGKTLITIHLQ